MPALYRDEEVQRWRRYRADVADHLAGLERLFSPGAAGGDGDGGDDEENSATPRR